MWSPPSPSWRGKSRPVPDPANRADAPTAGSPSPPPLLLGHGRPLLFEVLKELAQGFDGVAGVDCGALGGDVCLDDAPWVIHTICLVWLAWTCPFRGPGWPVEIHCLLCFLSWECDHHCLVYGHKAVQHGLGLAVDGGSEVQAHLVPLLFMFIIQQLDTVLTFFIYWGGACWQWICQT